MGDSCNPYEAKLPATKTNWRLHLVIIAYAITLTAFLGAAFVSKWEVVACDNDYEVVNITTLNPTVRTVIDCSAALSALILLSTGVAAICCRRICFGVITIMIAVGGYFASHVVAFLRNPAPWTTEAEIVAPDGNTYYFMDSSLLQGQTMAIAKLESKGVLTHRVNVLGTNNGDSPRSYASLVRPAGAPSHDYGQLYVTDLGMVIGIRYDNKCYLAYDTISDKFYGHGDVEEISPFVLIRPNTLMHQADVEAIIEEVKRGANFLSTDADIRIPAKYLAGYTLPGYPRAQTLIDGLSHANPTVQELSRRILDIHEAGLKKASERLAEPVEVLIVELKSEDVDMRRQAAQALGRIGGPGANPAVPALAVAVKDQDRNVRLFASQSLGLIGEPAVPTLLRLLRDEDESVRESALFGLYAAGPAARSAVPAIVEILTDKNAKMRAHAATTLGRIGPEARMAVPALIDAMKDEDNHVRYFAANALGNIGPTARAAIPVLTKALKDEKSSVRAGAARALKKIQ